MADEEHERVLRLKRYIERCLPLVGCSDWRVGVELNNEPDADRYADTSVYPCQRTATITFYEPFWALSDQNKIETVCHEMVHMHTMTAQYRLSVLLEPILGKKFWPGVAGLIDHELDEITDVIARSLVATFPSWR